MTFLKSLFRLAFSEWLASLALALSICLSAVFLSKVIVPNWTKTDGIVVGVSQMETEFPVGTGTDGASTSRTKCWVVNVEYTVLDKSYRTSQESVNRVSSKCDRGNEPYARQNLPKIQQPHEVWYDKNDVSNAVLCNELPLAHTIGFFVAFSIAAGFYIFFFKLVHRLKLRVRKI
jgi:hypothetical protein